MDFLTDLPTTPDGFDSIMVMVDHGLTKGIILQPCNKTINALQTAEVIIQTIYRRFGLPDKLISDRGPQFASAVFQEISKLLEIKHAMSTAYHPQTDGMTEHYMQEIETYLSIYCISNLTSWKESLITLEIVHSSRTHAGRKHSPFELWYGYQPPFQTLTHEQSIFPEVEEKLKFLAQSRREALALMKNQQNKWPTDYDELTTNID